ncbi:hypothetical protein BBJ29_006660 [Phytophthora kernoviae]|uniref:Methyltransferase type 11 domain-containing protein n=1 Tax=Phytophthora kernoviae TaxID=325452 RepID=A0A3R7JQG1_9STRA|nr:hypothetical protein BBJ29_006660 [Phytophthora kernoviae]
MSTGDSTSSNLLGCDALKVPLRTGAFDAALSIAVLHHISTEERRVALIRLVRVGGEVLIVAWAFEQDGRSKRRFEQQDVMVEWKLQQKYAQKNEDSDEAGDQKTVSHGHVDREKRWVVYERYCHVYRSGELEALIAQVPGLKLKSVEYSRSNWCLRIERVDC